MDKKKKTLIAVIAILIVILVAFGVYFLTRPKTTAPKDTKEPIEKVTVGSDSTRVDKDGKKSLVVYFSVPETNDPNKKMTTEEENSAIVVDGKVLGNTQYVAQLISEYTGADNYRIEPRTPYPTNHEDLVALAKEEQNKNVRPEIKSRIVDFDDYDIIYVGYPIWWSDMPQILYTFFELYDFNGKTVIPFSTHGGSGLAGTVSKIKEKLSGATVEENAFTMSRNVMETAPEEVKAWLEKIGRLNTSEDDKKEPTSKGKSLVAYFSLPETTDPNKKMTEEEENSAIVIDGVVYGNVEYMAKVISEETKSDVYRIEPKTPYTTNHADVVAIAQEEQNRNARPAIKDSVQNFEEYDTIYIGYPIWWSDMPQILYTFLESYDFSGKNVYIFSSHGGSGIAGTDSTIKNKLSSAKVNTNYLSISRNSMETTPNEVQKWLKEIGE